MSHQVQVPAGKKGVVLPDHRSYDGPVTVTLTDAQYASIPSRVFTNGTLIDVGASSDPLAGRWKGTWAVGIAYAIGDSVRYPGGTYLAIAASTGVVPGTDVNVWQQMAADGAPGMVELGYAESSSGVSTSTVGGTVAIPGCTKTLTVATGQSIVVEIGGIANLAASTQGGFMVKDDAGVEVTRAVWQTLAAGAAWNDVFARRRITPTPGSRTYTAYVYLLAGTTAGMLFGAAYPVALRIVGV